MTFSQLQIFASVVKAGNFTVAAGHLGMTQSGVSHAIAGLESELGVELLSRERGGVILTDAGKRMLVYAQEILTQADYMRQEAAQFAGGEKGKLRIGAIWSVSARLLPGIMGAFRRQHPGIEMILFEGTDQEVEDWIMSGAVDVGFLPLIAK